jgi:hypothetical protein
MGVDHGGFDIPSTRLRASFVAEEFLNSPNIIPGFKKVGGETVAEGVACGVFVNVCFANGFFDRLLEGAFAHVPATHQAGFIFFG